MKQRYIRKAIEVECEQYAAGCGLEDGFALWKDVILRGYTDTDNLIKIEKSDGTVVCPFVQSSRGVIYIKKDDFIIIEADKNKHCCSGEKFNSRYELIDS